MYLRPEEEHPLVFERAVRPAQGLRSHTGLPLDRFQMFPDGNPVRHHVQGEVEPAVSFEVVDSGFDKKVP